jgi:phosphatidate cytidylyltransferase
MKTFLTRSISAIVAVVVLCLIFYYFQADGLKIMCLFAVVLGARELSRMLFLPDDSVLLKISYFLLAIVIFSVAVYRLDYAAVSFSCFAILFFTLTLLRNRRFDDLSSLSQFQAKGILGLFYIGLLPAFGCKLLFLPNGTTWFFALLAIVLVGDTFAYLSGMLWGKKKLMPDISPKKTIVGSVGGLVGSMLAACLVGNFLDHIPVYYLILLGLVGGIFGQMGDLFESMLKRVAHVKDSGTLMPGHGGILDRIDGVLFTAPLVLAFASFFN